MTPLDPILHELADEHREQGAPAAVERALVAEFRRRHKRSWLPWWGAGVAVASASTALAFYLMQPPPVETLALSVAAPDAPEVRFTPKPVAPRKPVAPKVLARPRPTVARAEQVPAQAVPAQAAPPQEIATDFFPLRTGRVLEPGEVAQVVRTRISRRELARFGLTAVGYSTSRAAAQDVRADVVFGYDGTARAIRFIHDSQ